MSYISAFFFLIVGLLTGTVFFAALKETVRLFVRSGEFWRIILLYLGRIALVVLIFLWAALHGATDLLSAAGGFTIARLIVLRGERRPDV